MCLLSLRKYVDDEITKLSGKKPFLGYVEKGILTLQMSMYLRKNSPLNKIFNAKIDQLIESGIVKVLMDAQFEMSDKYARKQKEEEKQDDPKELTLEHLELSFYAVLIGLALSCVVFAVEILIGLFSTLYHYYHTFLMF